VDRSRSTHVEKCDSPLNQMRRRIVLLTMRALLIPIGLSIVVGIAASVACSTSVTISPVTPYGSCSDATSYAVVTAGYCPGLSCGTYYATCDGTEWNGCDCDIPSGYTLATGDFGFASGPPGCDDCDIAGDGGTGSETGSGNEGGAETGTSEAGAEETGTSEAGAEETGTSEAASTQEAGSTTEAGM
jgi:hypothetical protein